MINFPFDRQINKSSSNGSFPKCSGARNPTPGVHRGGKELITSAIPFCLLMVPTSSKQELEWSWDSNLGTDMDVAVPSNIFTTRTSACL